MASLDDIVNQLNGGGGVGAPQPSSMDEAMAILKAPKQQKQGVGGKVLDTLTSGPLKLGGTFTPNLKPKKGKKLTPFRTTLKQLMKPVGATASMTRGISEFGGHAMFGEWQQASDAIGTNLDKAIDVIAGKEETSWPKEFSEVKPLFGDSPASKLLHQTVALTDDFILDPLNITKPVKLAAKGLEKVGLLGPTKKLGDIIKATPAAQKLKTLFSNAASDPKFNEFVTKVQSMKTFRGDEFVRNARSIQKDFKKLGRGLDDVVTNALEDPAARALLDPKTEGVVQRIEGTYGVFLKQLKEHGITIGEIKYYTPHMRTAESFLGKLKNYGLGSKEWSMGPIAEKRGLLNIVDESGKTIIGKASDLGLKRFNSEKAIAKIEKIAAQKTGTLQSILDRLARPEIQKNTKELTDLISKLKQNISKAPKTIGGATDDLLEPTAREFDDIIKGIVTPKQNELKTLIAQLQKEVQTSGGKEFEKGILGLKNSRSARIKDISDKIIETQNAASEAIKKAQAFDLVGTGNKFYKSSKATLAQLRANGIDIFEKNPIVALLKRGEIQNKALASKEFTDGVRHFAIKDGVPVANKALEGLKFAPDQAAIIDNFYSAIKPTEFQKVFKYFDKLQGWWKGQALLGPSYHVRNMAGNLWNNFLAGVNPLNYYKAHRMQFLGENPEMLLLARQHGVLKSGQFMEDVVKETAGIGGGLRQGLNPLNSQNYLIKANRAVGGSIEDNPKLAHFIEMVGRGMTPEAAAQSVKKYLFDYEDLSKVERLLFKRLVPFYTWTRKNLPLQVSELFKQPGKFAVAAKVINQKESTVPKPNEKYMSAYLKDNVPVRIRKDKNGNTEYFMLGNWLPFAQAVDILSQPFDSLLQMLTPIAKFPIENLTNQSFFFKNTLDRFGKTENRPGEKGEYAKMFIRKRSDFSKLFTDPKEAIGSDLLRNIRILNEFNNFQNKKDKTAPRTSLQAKLLNLLFGKTGTYDMSSSQYFYNKDTEDEMQSIISNMKSSVQKGFPEEAKKQQTELQRFLKSR
jgi:hypothetical protein